MFSSCLWSELNPWSTFYIATAIHHFDISETESTLSQNTQQVKLFRISTICTLHSRIVSKHGDCNGHDFISFQRFGTKHVVATNMILWLGTVIKESVEEIVEQGKEAESVSLILVMPILVALLK